MTCAGCSKLQNEAQRITLNTGRVVCNFCPDWMEECLNREHEARRFIEMPREKAIDEYRRRKDEGEDLTRLDAVIMRLKKHG